MIALPWTFAVLVQQRARENQAAFFAIAIRRNVDRDFTDAVIEVLAKRAFLDEFFGVLVGSADDAHVDGDFFAPADAFDDAFLQEAQHLRLQRKRHVADLVEKQRTAVRHLDLAERLFVRTRKRAFLVAEQLGLEQVLGNGRTVDRNEVFVGVRAETMQRACEQFFAGAAFAEQERGHVGRRDLFDHPTHGQHAFAGGNDAVERRLADRASAGGDSRFRVRRC